MSTKQQIDNLKIGDTIMVHRKQGKYIRKGSRNIKYGSDEWTITGFTKTQIRVNHYYEYANVALDSFTISWDLIYPEIIVPPAPDYPAVWLNGEWQNAVGVGYLDYT